MARRGRGRERWVLGPEEEGEEDGEEEEEDEQEVEVKEGEEV